MWRGTPGRLLKKSHHTKLGVTGWRVPSDVEQRMIPSLLGITQNETNKQTRPEIPRRRNKKISRWGR